MAAADKRKQSLYFPEDMLKEIQDEANRQDRSLSWIVQQAWRYVLVGGVATVGDWGSFWLLVVGMGWDHRVGVVCSLILLVVWTS